MPCQPIYNSGNRLSIAQVFALWQQQGGNYQGGLYMTAVALAESALDIYATSTDCARGIWQITDGTGAGYGATGAALYDTSTNACIAVALSQDGTYFSPWDVAYNNLENAAERYVIHALEPYSPAAQLLQTVVEAVGGNLQGGGGSITGSTPGFPGGIATSPGPPPQQTFPPTQVPAAPYPGYVQPVPAVQVPGNLGGGWDNLRNYFGYDLPNIYALDQALRSAVFFPERQG